LEEMWVDANFKEVQLQDLRVGQPAKIKTDIYGGSFIYSGKVLGVGAGTGSVFSLLPPQNATGNWIKIVQRIPVRLKLDAKELKKYPLMLGLSCEVTVDVHDKEGVILIKDKPLQSAYRTDIFESQEAGAEEVIAKIIEDNVLEKWRS
ncbi:MAG: HlyD family secretion protein, partial [Anaerolineae bacterium]